jgi:GTP pyrophosphokinase
LLPPHPGDRIVGIVTTGKGVTVHTHDCHMLENFAASPERFLDVEWDEGGLGSTAHTVRLTVAAMNGPSSLGRRQRHQQAEGHAHQPAPRPRRGRRVRPQPRRRGARHPPPRELMGTLRACEGVIRVDRARG